VRNSAPPEPIKLYKLVINGKLILVLGIFSVVAGFKERIKLLNRVIHAYKIPISASQYMSRVFITQT
jgi:hypothetical protein